MNLHQMERHYWRLLREISGLQNYIKAPDSVFPSNEIVKVEAKAKAKGEILAIQEEARRLEGYLNAHGINTD